MKNRITTAMIVVSALFIGGIQMQAATLTVLDYPGLLNPNTKFNNIFGDYVVGSYTPSRSSSGTAGLIYNRSTENWATVNVSGARSTTLMGVHNGYAVGSYVSGSPGNLVTSGFTYRQTGGAINTIIHPDTGVTSTTLTGIFNNLVVGNRTTSSGTSAFIYDLATQTYQDFVYGGDSSTTVGDIFGNTIVGNYSGGGYVYNLLTGAGSDFNFPGSGNTSTLNGISGDGDIAGSFSNSNGTFGFYHEGTNYNSLNFTGTDNTEAGGVYQDLIVGNFLGKDGKVHAFIYDTATVPEPSTSILLSGFGTLLLLKRRR